MQRITVYQEEKVMPEAAADTLCLAFKKKYWSPLLILRGHILRPQWMPEALNNTQSYLYCFSLYTCTNDRV